MACNICTRWVSRIETSSQRTSCWMAEDTSRYVSLLGLAGCVADQIHSADYRFWRIRRFPDVLGEEDASQQGLCGSEPYIAPEQFEHKGKRMRDFHIILMLLTQSFRIRCPSSRYLGHCYRLLLHAVPRDSVAHGQEPVRRVLRLIRAIIPSLNGSSTAAQPDAQGVP